MTTEAAWLLGWNTLDRLARAAQNPREALHFIEGGDYREAMQDLFAAMFKLADGADDLQANIAEIYRLEISRLPVMGAA